MLNIDHFSLFCYSMASPMNDQETTFIPCSELERFMIEALMKLGVTQNDAETCARITLLASKRGIDSHGVERFKAFYYDRIKNGIVEAVSKPEIIRETPTTAVIDGHNGMGHTIGSFAMNLAIQKAKNYGLGMTVVRNSTHYGIAGYYTELAIKENMIGMTGTNARPAIAPTFGAENMIGTNPIAFGMPTDEDFPLIFDAATSLAQRGKIEKHARENKPLPEGWVINGQGKIITDPHEALTGLTNGTCALTPIGGIGTTFGGHKGYGLATIVEVLSSALQQGSFLTSLTGIEDGKQVPFRIGHFFIAFDINAFVEPEKFKKTTGDILRALRASKKLPNQDRIYTPFEIEHETENKRLLSGIPLKQPTIEQLQQIAKDCTIRFNVNL